jgi:hypothetical protein
MLKALTTSQLGKDAMLGQGADQFWPGKVQPVMDMRDIDVLRMEIPNVNTLLQLIQHLERMIQQATNTVDATHVVGENRKTATQSHNEQEMISLPVTVRMEMFAQNFLEPALDMALVMIQENLGGNQQVVVKGRDGIEKPLMISEREIKTGKYRVRANLDKQDQMRIAKAQSIERVIPVISNPNVQQMLMAERKIIKIGPMIQEYLKFMDIDDELVISDAPPPPPMPPGGPPGMGGPPMPPGGPPNAGPPQPGQRPPLQLVRGGGPMGQDQGNPNAMAQLLQLFMRQGAPNQEPEA